ncbi:hypothetical protein [Streptantibioticus ferralitis]|uniref:Lipoprotein n=1 Tax=Streptantibioticus ferralitis TaxID=236510 RepID=A0ABT5Z403_9ACTN|nr:hypothetical protein [Streptantibioticus ferralitis]MDF2258524.1 hypothetical protein [Streptantibioticus ferralitis]
MTRLAVITKGGALAVCLAVGAVGCSSSGSASGTASRPAQPPQTPESVATAYYKAKDAADWKRMCELSTEANRAAEIGASGVWSDRDASDMPAPTVGNCVTAHQGNNAESHTWQFDARVNVPAFGAHPAGVGLRASCNFTEEGKPQTNGYAVRLVSKDGSWLVDQVTVLATPESSDPQKVVNTLSEDH